MFSTPTEDSPSCRLPEKQIPRQASILVIDDDPVFRRAAQRALEFAGYATTPATDGKTGLDFAQDDPPDLILLDLALPDVNGIVVLQVLRSYSKTAHIPILIITWQPDPESLLKTVALGQAACGFLHKPFTPEELVARVRAMLDKRGATAPSQDEFDSPAGKLRYLRRGALIVDLFGKRMWIGTRVVRAPTERRFEFLCALLRREGPVSGRNLLQDLWDEIHDESVVRATVKRLREDLLEYPEIGIASSRGGYELVWTGGQGSSRKFVA